MFDSVNGYKTYAAALVLIAVGVLTRAGIILSGEETTALSLILSGLLMWILRDHTSGPPGKLATRKPLRRKR